jgi:hypothetical protein
VNGDGRLLGRLALDRRLVRVLTVVFVGVIVSTLVVYFSTKDTVEGLAMGQTHQTLGFFDRELGWRVREMTARIQLWSDEDPTVWPWRTPSWECRPGRRPHGAWPPGFRGAPSTGCF